MPDRFDDIRADAACCARASKPIELPPNKRTPPPTQPISRRSSSCAQTPPQRSSSCADITATLSASPAQPARPTPALYTHNKLLRLQKKNAQLRDLLKECRRALETYAAEDETCGLEEENQYAKHLLPRINAAIGESEGK